MNSEVLSALELRRYSQQIELTSVGIAGQEKIKQSKILVVGAGGKGTSVMQYLVASGVGKIGISDNFMVGENVLPNQRLYGNSDLGKQKAIISRQKLKELNQLVQIELYNICLTEINILPICSDYDIVVDATDNFPAHYLINDAALSMNKPFVYGCAFKSQVHVSVFNYLDGPSFRCLYPTIPSDQEKPSMAGVTAKGIITGMAGAIMANEVLKIILGLDNTLSGKLFIFNVPDYTVKFKNIEKNPDNFLTKK